MTRWAILLLAGLAVLAGASATAETLDETTRYFAIRGTTLAELDRDLNRRGPFVAETGLRHPGATEVKFDGHVTYKRVAEGCAVDMANVKLTLNMLLPKWAPPRGVAPETILIWRTLESDIERHEKHHADIAKSWLKRMEMALRNLRPEPSCARMETLVNQVTQRYLAGHERAQVEFDTIEGREVNFRLRRALSRAVSDYRR